MENSTEENSSIELTTMTRYGTSSKPSEDSSDVDKTAKVELDRNIEDTEAEGINSSNDEEGAPREQWDNRIQFILTLIGYAVGLGNVWRFSYYCAKNGGSAFLIPYIIMLFVLGIPLFYLELSLGQAVKKGPVRAWFKISPNLGGIGISALIVNSFIVIYYNVILSWVFFYLFNTFHKDLPWGVCFGHVVLQLNDNETMEILKNFSGRTDLASCFNASTEYFWYTDALGVSDSIDHAQNFNWKIFLCLLLAWIVVYLCLFRGIKSSGKVIYFTATFPYVVLVCLFFRAVTLPGASIGLKFLFLPSDGWSSNLFSPQVWLEASTQIFFSLGLSIGALVALASYSKPRYNTLANSVIVCMTNSITSIFSSIIVFSIIGFQAAQTDTDPQLVSRGPGLAFVIFTEAVLHMPGSPFWGFLFFVMLLTLGLDSQFATVEAIITVFYDIEVMKKTVRKEIFVGILCAIFFVLSIPFILGNGVYLFALFDQFAGSIPLLLIGFFEFIAVGWVCGVERFFKEYTKPNHPYLVYVWIVMWKWVGPIIMFIIFISSIVLEVIRPLSYTLYSDETYEELEKVYPDWALFIGAMIILSSVLMIPTFLIVRLIGYQSAREEGMEFILRVVQLFKDAIQYAKQFPEQIKKFPGWVKKSITLRRDKWSPQINEDSDSLVPYQKDTDHYDEIPAFHTDEKNHD